MLINYEINYLKQLSNILEQLINTLQSKKNEIDREIILKGLLDKMKNNDKNNFVIQKILEDFNIDETFKKGFKNDIK